MSENEPMGGSAPSRVLVGVDGSPDGLRAVRYAARAALVGDAGVWVVHVVDDSAPVAGLWELVSSTDALRHSGEAYLADARAVLAEEGLPDERVTAEVQIGRPGEVLAELSREAGLLVVGRRSLSGLERMFVGSTSLATVLAAHCPVVVISAASTPHRTGEQRTVAVAVNAWPLYEPALEWAAGQAAARGAVLRVVHVVPEGLELDRPELVAAATTELEGRLAPLRAARPDLQMTLELVPGEAVDTLVEASRTADLLVLGLHGDHAVPGGTLRGVLAHAHCPVGITR